MGRMTLDEAMTRASTVDRDKLEATTEQDIARYQREDGFDPEAEIDLASVAEVYPPRVVRQRLGLSQDAFAVALRIPAGTLRNWEQGRTRPDPAVQALFRIIAREPEAAMRALRVTLPAERGVEG